MVKKLFSLIVLAGFVFLANGCNTTAKTVPGAQNEEIAGWREIQKADAWVKKNLW